MKRLYKIVKIGLAQMRATRCRRAWVIANARAEVLKLEFEEAYRSLCKAHDRNPVSPFKDRK